MSYRRIGTVEVDSRRRISLARVLESSDIHVNRGDVLIVEEGSDGVLRLTPAVVRMEKKGK